MNLFFIFRWSLKAAGFADVSGSELINVEMLGKETDSPDMILPSFFRHDQHSGNVRVPGCVCVCGTD